ncbi:MAG: phenylalanine--tRNA ligase subunit beta [Acidobacteriaceae bacterium]|nr:phenylalanine--tRNA ligase subunit beta [Acidobacteriaceae bacterium]
MKFSYRWLCELVPGLDTVPAELERIITMKTAECEGIEAFRPANPEVAPDWIIEIDNKSLTHRPDLWGHMGMAREVAAITHRTLQDPVCTQLLPRSEPVVEVRIEDFSLCPRYSALLVEGIEVQPSAPWLQARLESIGLNPINNIVDITNYVLAELPQPMHAFDAEKLDGPAIHVRTAHSGEQLAALNGETYDLDRADLVIADASGPVAVAGVIGGADTAISETTARVILESANFQATSVRLTSARHKLRTDASMRFEKSLDPENTVRGLARALALMKQICPGIRVLGGVSDSRSSLPQPKPISLPLAFVSCKLGKHVTRPHVTEILEALGFGVSETGQGMLTVTVPTWRATKDISLKDDLVEEIGRIIGYDQITPAAPLIASTVPPDNPMRGYLRQIRSQIASQGFTEVYNYSFVNETDVKRFSLNIDEHVAVRNPIASELTHLRRSLLPGLFNSIVVNVRNFQEFRLFEIGSEIHPRAGGELPREIAHLAAVLYNAHGDEQDFFELKRVVECLFPDARLTPAPAKAYEHPTRTAEIAWSGVTIGRIFELHPSLLHGVGIEGRAVLFDVDLEAAAAGAASRIKQYRPVRRYPTSGFDLSIVTGMRVPVARIEDDLRKLAGEGLAEIHFVRQYAGPPLDAGQKSVSYHIEVGAFDHTLTADEVAAIRGRIIDGMRQLGYDLRV